ncbi:MAG: UDP-3-O-(3-hydroxymyristoyl)glucosamine N-acyltransferase [Hyphomicrobiaceae bacterium]
MEHPGFFDRAGPFTLDVIARATGSELAPGADGERQLTDIRPLGEAAANHLSFLDNKKYLPLLSTTTAGACLVQPAFVERMSSATVALVTKSPYRGFAQALALFYPQAMRPRVAVAGSRHMVDPSARLEDGVEIQPGAIVGAEAVIGRGTIIAAGAVVGYRCTIGRDSFIGPTATVTHALIGDRVILHAGVRIGQDGFGFAMGPRGHLKVPQIGRVIIQDDVEIGANSTIDRGALKDTIIGEGTKIDNLVQIGHNVVMGRHCVIVGQCGIAGSTEVGDFVVMGGQAGLVGHIKVGAGTQVAGGSHVKDDVPPRSKLIGTPARPIRQWIREQAAITRLGAASTAPVDEADD